MSRASRDDELRRIARLEQRIAEIKRKSASRGRLERTDRRARITDVEDAQVALLEERILEIKRASDTLWDPREGITG
jgi:hypothetical protein